MKKIIALHVDDQAKVDGGFRLPMVAIDEDGKSYSLCLNESGGVDLRPRQVTAQAAPVQKKWTRREVQALVYSKGGQAGATHLIEEFLPTLKVNLPVGEFLGEKIVWYFSSFEKLGEEYIGHAVAHAHIPYEQQYAGWKEDVKQKYPDIEVRTDAGSVEIFSAPHMYPEYEDLYFMVPKSVLLD